MENFGALQWITLFLSLIAVAPFLFRFIPAVAHYLMCKVYPVQKVIIQHKHDGIVLKSVTIDLKSSTPLVTQIALAAKDKGDAHG